MRRRHLERDVCAGMTRTDDQHWAVLQLRGTPVTSGMQLRDRRVELRRETRHEGTLLRAGGDDHVVRRQSSAARRQNVPGAVPRQLVNANAALDRELEPLCIRLE